MLIITAILFWKCHFFLSEQTTPEAISITPNENKLFIVWTVGKYVKIEMDKKILSKPVFALILGCK